MRSMKALIFSAVPVISKTKDSSVESTARARKISALRKASIRLSPEQVTLTKASSRSIYAPSIVRSETSRTGTRRESCDFICSITAGVPVQTIVMRDRCSVWSVSATVRLSML